MSTPVKLCLLLALSLSMVLTWTMGSAAFQHIASPVIVMAAIIIIILPRSGGRWG